MANIIRYLGSCAIVIDMFDNMESVSGTVTSFDVPMHGLCHLQQVKHEQVTAFITQLEGPFSDIV